jgi:hypothetical protein
MNPAGSVGLFVGSLQSWVVAYREAHVLLEEIADATLDGTRTD